MPSTVQLSGNYQVKMLPYADIRSRKEQAANFPVGLAKTRSLAQLSKEDRKVVQDIQKQYPGLRPLVVENSLPKSPAAFSLNLGVGKPPSRKLLKQEGVENPVHIHNKQEAERLAGDFWSRGYNLNQRTEGANIISPGSSTERVKMGASTDEVLKNNLGKCSPQQIKQIRVGLDDLAAELAQANVAFPGCSVKISVDPSNPNSRPTVELENLEHMVPAGHKDFKKAKEEALKGIKALTEDIREIQEERGDHAAGATGKA